MSKPIGAAGLALFLVGMKYGDRVEQALIRRLRPQACQKKPEKF